MNRIAWVTGASSGIGLATARELAARGFHVVAGVRRDGDAGRIAAPGIEPVILDVTDPEDVERAGELARQQGDVGVLVNNAGIAISGPAETIAIADWRRQFEVNLFGHIAVTQALLPELVRGHGRIVNVSSVSGLIASPGVGPYVASKFALEGLSDVMRRELRPLGVRVVVVEPGAVATPMWSKGRRIADEVAARARGDRLDRYAEMRSAVREQSESLERAGVDPAEVARVIAHAVAVATPRARYTVGRDARLMAVLSRWLPDRTLDRIIARRLGLG
jgi:NAD(P)-dependent dehydrogenase (short-subunit alcohol dehydrogenase family)